MTSRGPFVIGEVPGFTPGIGRLVSMMRYVRQTTEAAVTGLTVAQLDYLHDARSNSIGALLSHVVAVESWYQAKTFFGRDLDADEMREWGSALDLGDAARTTIRGRPLEHYLERMRRVRERTLEELRRRDDAWLDEMAPFWEGQPANNHFKWFHVFEDELNHRGQIRWLRARAAAAD
ncbi:MAG TPA: DUF664 domain-containing protein [Thermoanaerobaculia bacterium]|jgi:uncharacterized damage-inducible protein DinB|nr:DUF664 domain-containing protein [Thermoanaerobaculia bacterium]